jgi:hypothetical protein
MRRRTRKGIPAFRPLPFTHSIPLTGRQALGCSSHIVTDAEMPGIELPQEEARREKW